jgi:hypothetical protein
MGDCARDCDPPYTHLRCRTGGWREDPADEDRAGGGKCGLTVGAGSWSFTTLFAEPQGGATHSGDVPPGLPAALAFRLGMDYSDGAC